MTERWPIDSARAEDVDVCDECGLEVPTISDEWVLKVVR